MDRLLERLYQEQQEYKTMLLNGTKDKIFEKSYETAIRQEIVNYFEYAEIDTDLRQYLLELDDILGWLYDEYLGDDTVNVYSEVEVFIDNCAFKIKIKSE